MQPATNLQLGGVCLGLLLGLQQHAVALNVAGHRLTRLVALLLHGLELTYVSLIPCLPLSSLFGSYVCSVVCGSRTLFLRVGVALGRLQFAFKLACCVALCRKLLPEVSRFCACLIQLVLQELRGGGVLLRCLLMLGMGVAQGRLQLLDCRLCVVFCGDKDGWIPSAPCCAGGAAGRIPDWLGRWSTDSMMGATDAPRSLRNIGTVLLASTSVELLWMYDGNPRVTSHEMYALMYKHETK